MALTTVQGELLESGSALENIGAGNITPAFLNTQAQYTGFKNRIINGAMVIDQRNAGASVSTSSGSGVFTVDRWIAQYSATSKFTIQQSSVAPTGFTKSVLITSSDATSVTASAYYLFSQRIEGFNTADLGFGTANAKTITISFWVHSSLTGTFGGSLTNDAQDRNYPFSYTISSANTWEQKSITISGDVTGTWATDNTCSFKLWFSLGVGSTFQGTANTWGATNYFSTTGETQVVATNGATWYLTGVQLEVGSTATSFDYRPYGTELALCRRYFTKYYQNTGGLAGDSALFNMANWNGTEAYGSNWFQVSMRAAPSFSYSSLSDFTWYNSSTTKIPTAIDQQGASIDRCEMKVQWSGSISTGTSGWLRIGGSANNGWVQWSAEL